MANTVEIETAKALYKRRIEKVNRLNYIYKKKNDLPTETNTLNLNGATLLKLVQGSSAYKHREP